MPDTKMQATVNKDKVKVWIDIKKIVWHALSKVYISGIFIDVMLFTDEHVGHCILVHEVNGECL